MHLYQILVYVFHNNVHEGFLELDAETFEKTANYHERL